MRRRLAIGGGLVGLVVVCATAWAVVSRSSGSLDDEQQEVVDAVESGEAVADPGSFVERHVDVLLSADVADAVDRGALTDLFAAALQREDVFGRVVAAVADEGEIYHDALRPVFADAAAAHMGWIDERVSAPAEYGLNGAPDQVRDEYLAVHDFLRETMRDERAAGRLREAVDEYGLAETVDAPDTGEARARRFADLGRLQAFVDETRRNAEVGAAVEDEDADALEAADDADSARRSEAAGTRAAWLATDLYSSSPAIQDAARGQPFVDASGALKTAMNPEEAEAFRTWATTLIVEGGPAADDYDPMASGADTILNPPHGIVIEDRY